MRQVRNCRWRLKKSALRGQLTLETEMSSNGSSSSSAVLVHLGGLGGPRMSACDWLGVLVAVGLPAGEGGDVVIVIVWCCGVRSCVCVFVVSSIEREVLGPSGWLCI